MFRVAQESLTNVHRHSGATSAKPSLTEDAYAIRLEVTDEGKGLPDGIRGMLERMRLLGGRLEVDSGGGGTTVRAILPASSGRRDPAADEMSPVSPTIELDPDWRSSAKSAIPSLL